MSALPRLTLVLGGTRSGKSAFAEAMFAGQGSKLYIATGMAFDDEMRERITLHRDRRGPPWRTIEEPLALAECLRENSRKDQPILVDCLTLWLGNLMAAERDIDKDFHALCTSLADLPGAVVLVSSEVGLGIVPDNAMARAFRDHAGRLHQTLARQADRVAFIAAGLPLLLKDSPAQGIA
jgi:adenosylcobinamide kinase/adenosylcobinamide-phosphate guanylyltransferase